MIVDARLCLIVWLGLNDDVFGGNEMCSFLGKLLFITYGLDYLKNADYS